MMKAKTESILIYSSCIVIMLTAMVNPVIAFFLAVLMIIGMSAYHQYMV
jgi:hypothetical protein